MSSENLVRFLRDLGYIELGTVNLHGCREIAYEVPYLTIFLSLSNA
jgi:hypothetical protein